MTESGYFHTQHVFIGDAQLLRLLQPQRFQQFARQMTHSAADRQAKVE